MIRACYIFGLNTMVESKMRHTKRYQYSPSRYFLISTFYFLPRILYEQLAIITTSNTLQEHQRILRNATLSEDSLTGFYNGGL